MASVNSTTRNPTVTPAASQPAQTQQAPTNSTTAQSARNQSQFQGTPAKAPVALSANSSQVNPADVALRRQLSTKYGQNTSGLMFMLIPKYDEDGNITSWTPMGSNLQQTTPVQKGHGGKIDPKLMSQLLANWKPGMDGGQCSAFVATVETGWTPVGADELGPVNGIDTAAWLERTHGWHADSGPQVGDVFSMPVYDRAGNLLPCGHTGIIIGFDGNKPIVMDSNWGEDRRVQIHELDFPPGSTFASPP